MTLKALVIDDVSINRSVARALLEKLNYVVTEADDTTYKKTCASQGFDLILVDFHMPTVMGDVFIRDIRASGGASGRAHILMHSANASSDDVRLCMAAGANGFIGKPLHADKLRTMIETKVVPTTAKDAQRTQEEVR